MIRARVEGLVDALERQSPEESNAPDWRTVKTSSTLAVVGGRSASGRRDAFPGAGSSR